MKKRYILLIILVCTLVSYKACPRYFANHFALLTEGNYFIPKESNICSFQRTMSAGGSGDGWLYGEDDKYYYGLNIDNELDPCTVYYILEKEKVSQKFDKHNYRTWNKKEMVRWLPEKFRMDKYTEDCNK